MCYLRNVLGAAIGLFLLTPNINAQSAPEILFPDPVYGALLYGLSDNGHWGVSSTPPGSSGFSDFAGATIYDLTTNPVKSVDLSQGEPFCSAFDVTDDGMTVVGSFAQQPAICRQENGVWTWYKLPIPDREISVRNVYTDEMMVYKLNGGEVYNITPDGRYAVGLATSVEYINLEVACMWDLETMELMELPGLGLERSTFSRLSQISADGRYVVGRSGGYFLYDRETQTRKGVRVGQDIYAQGMSTNGNYMAGVTQRNEVPYASFWDVQADKVTVLEDDTYADAVAWTITNDGVPLIARPYLTPYADAYVYHDGFLFSFEEILTQVYGINLANYNIDNTGKPFKVSADGRTIVLIRGVNDSYVLRFNEDIRDAADRIDLFRTWNAFPANGTRMTALKKVDIKFAHPVKINDDAAGQIELLDSKGNTLATPVENNGVAVNGSILSLQFRTLQLEAGEEYSLRIPEGVLGIAGRESSRNSEIIVKYTGRENVPVKPVKISPEDGASVPMLSLNENPIVITFEDMIQLNIQEGDDRPIAGIYIDEETDPVAFANMDIDTNTGNTLVVFPLNTVPLYKGSYYRVEIPDGVVTDLSGNGASEAISLTYTGSYVPQIGDEKYIFHSTCDDYTNFLFYDGDKGTPTSEYEAMGFSAFDTPWIVVREDENSVDMAFGSHSVYTDGRQADDWVVTRQLLIPEGSNAYLAFDSQSYRKSKKDYLKVYIYEHAGLMNTLNSATIEDIRTNGDLVYNQLQETGPTEDYLSGEWTHNTIDLSNYVGKSIYICFVNDNQNQSMVMIDNIEVIKDVKAFVTMRNKTNVVRQDEIPIWGILTISSERAQYDRIDMTLKDSEGKVVSTIHDENLNLTASDYYIFEFTDPLGLEQGTENRFTIEYKLNDDELAYEGLVRNLTFEPVKRVVIEEFTGRDCQYCPGGILTIEHLESLYGEQVIPIALHCYNGSDPKGAYVMGYWQYTGMDAAPQARINRGPVSSPLYQTPSGYINSTAGLPEGSAAKLWKDYVIEELEEAALMEVELEEGESIASSLVYTAKIRSAINLEDQNVRVFGVLLEDGLIDYQVNAYYSTTDPLLGEWGQGGLRGTGRVYYEFNNVARTTWGVSYNGSGMLIPQTIEAGKVYEVKLSVPVPDNVADRNKLKMAVMLIDGNTGRVINATRSDIKGTIGGVGMTADCDVEVSFTGDDLQVNSPEACEVTVFGLAGQTIAYGRGEALFTLPLNGYRGVTIIKAVTAKGSKTFKLMIR